MHGQCKIYNGPKNPYKKRNFRITCIHICYSLMGFLLGYTPQKTEVFKIFFLLKAMFLYVMLRLYTEIYCPTMPGTGQKVWVGVWWVVL